MQALFINDNFWNHFIYLLQNVVGVLNQASVENTTLLIESHTEV